MLIAKSLDRSKKVSSIYQADRDFKEFGLMDQDICHPGQEPMQPYRDGEEEGLGSLTEGET